MTIILNHLIVKNAPIIRNFEAGQLGQCPNRSRPFKSQLKINKFYILLKHLNILIKLIQYYRYFILCKYILFQSILHVKIFCSQIVIR